MSSSYRGLVVWQKSIDLITRIYEVTREFPKDEMYGLTGQIRRAAVSIASNIAEGHGRIGVNERRQFIGHARGSCLEVETQIVVAGRLRFLRPDSERTLSEAASEVGRMLNGLLKSFDHAKGASV
jgi:four helix bundle protein